MGSGCDDVGGTETEACSQSKANRGTSSTVKQALYVTKQMEDGLTDTDIYIH